MEKLFSVESFGHPSSFAGLQWGQVSFRFFGTLARWLIRPLIKEPTMHVIRISKRNGKFRTIYVPNAQEREKLVLIAGTLSKKAERICDDTVVHGFMHGRSAVSNATTHVGHEYTLCFDLEDFFDTVKPQQVKGLLSDQEIKLTFVDGAPRQGYPTSPAIANLAASKLDKAILTMREKRKVQFVYTRYADDLSFSFDDVGIVDLLKQEIPQIVARCGFKLNKDKTQLQCAKAGRRIITGVAVGDQHVYATRKSRRRLRAAKHQGRRAQIHGLTEWCKCNMPKDRRRFRDMGTEIERLCAAWKLPKLNIDKLPYKGEDVDLGKGCIITGDPVYMLGMSTWTTGWKSCMTHPGGSYRKKSSFWCYLRGTRIAALLSDKEKVVNGVSRKVMVARTLLHELRNGQLVFDRFYGDKFVVLEARLRAIGAISVSEARKTLKGEKVVGHVPVRLAQAYFDNLHSCVAKAKVGDNAGKDVRVVFV
jgi:hypothetical protein